MWAALTAMETADEAAQAAMAAAEAARAPAQPAPSTKTPEQTLQPGTNTSILVSHTGAAARKGFVAATAFDVAAGRRRALERLELDPRDRAGGRSTAAARL
jgi:hypothetical protein